MTTLELPVNEAKRMEALKKYAILDTPPDGAFDRITKLAASIFKVPIAIISLVDTDRIWFKSHYGLTVNQIGRDPGLCASAILSDDVYVLGDASTDPRSLANPLVAGAFGLKFYAAMPLQTDDLCNLGTLCIIDKSPRTFTEDEKEVLKQLAQIVMDEMELRLVLRNTVTNIKNLTSDLYHHLEETINDVQQDNTQDQKESILAHLDASRIFVSNIENQLDNL